jgi:hypothetical protein
LAVNKNTIKQHFQLLKNADPRAYDALTTLCEGYVNDLMAACVMASQDGVLVAQGRAQQGVEFLRLMTEPPTTPQK